MMLDREIILQLLKGTQRMLFDNNKWTVNSDNKAMQNNFKFMFVENFIVNLCILLFVCKVRKLNVCVCVSVCAIMHECTVLY